MYSRQIINFGCIGLMVYNATQMNVTLLLATFEDMLSKSGLLVPGQYSSNKRLQQEVSYERWREKEEGGGAASGCIRCYV